MRTRPFFALMAASLIFGGGSLHAFTLMFSSADFGKTNTFSTVNTFAFEIQIADAFQPGLFADPTITNIQYSVSGSLDTTPSGFPAFAFQLNHIFPSSPPITGTDFYGLNASAVPGQTLRFEISPTADLSNGLQIDELLDLGGGVVFRLDGREEGTGRYPKFVSLGCLSGYFRGFWRWKADVGVGMGTLTACSGDRPIERVMTRWKEWACSCAAIVESSRG